MPRIATAIATAAAMPARKAGMRHQSGAREMPSTAIRAAEEMGPAVSTGSAKVLSLLLIVEAMRQAPVSLDAHKV